MKYSTSHSPTRTGLFAEYVNTWLKLKQENAGWPADCDTEEKKAEYIRSYKEHEGIQLENVADNPGRKAIAKLLLNRHNELHGLSNQKNPSVSS